MSKAPLGCLALLFFLGNVAAFVPADFSFTSALSVSLLLLWLLLLSQIIAANAYRWFFPMIFTALLVFLSFSLGYLRAAASHRYPAHHVLHQVDVAPEITLLGEAITSPAIYRSASTTQRFVLKAERAYGPDTMMAVTGLIQVSMAKTTAFPFPGHLVLIKGKLGHPPEKRNPGAFDYRAYLARKGIYTIFEAEEMRVLGPAPGITSTTRRITHNLQQQIDAYLRAHLSQEASRSILNALLLGDQSDIASDTRHSFQQTGLTHVLAVSGLHVMLVGLLVYQLLRPMCLRMGFSWRKTEGIRTAITLIILCLYMAITGSKAPVVRAVLMAFLMIAGTLFQRPNASLNAAGAAAFILLVYRPAYVFDIGFQLSFAAVLSILLLSNSLMQPPFISVIPRQWMRSSIFRPVLQSIVVSISATLGTMPVLLYHFGYISFAGIVLNLVALPLTAAALSAGLAMIVSAPFSSSLAIIFGAAAEIIATALIFLAQAGAHLFSFLTLAPGQISLTTLLFLLAACLLSIVGRFKQYRWRLVACSVAIAAIVCWAAVVSNANRPTISVVFFDVGHGDACFIQFPNGKNLLIDTGNRTPHTDQAKQVILPFLKTPASLIWMPYSLRIPIWIMREASLRWLHRSLSIDSLKAHKTPPNQAFQDFSPRFPRATLLRSTPRSVCASSHQQKPSRRTLTPTKAALFCRFNTDIRDFYFWEMLNATQSTCYRQIMLQYSRVMW